MSSYSLAWNLLLDPVSEMWGKYWLVKSDSRNRKESVSR